MQAMRVAVSRATCCDKSFACVGEGRRPMGMCLQGLTCRVGSGPPMQSPTYHATLLRLRPAIRLHALGCKLSDKDMPHEASACVAACSLSLPTLPLRPVPHRQAVTRRSRAILARPLRTRAGGRVMTERPLSGGTPRRIPTHAMIDGTSQRVPEQM